MKTTQHIGTRLVWMGMLGALVLALALSSILIGIDYRQQQRQVAARADAVLAQLSDSELLQSDELARSAGVRGLFVDPYLILALVEGEEGILAIRARPVTENSLRKIVEILFGGMLLREIRIDNSSLYATVIYDRIGAGTAFLQRSFEMLAYSLLLALGVAAVLLLIVKTFLTGPIERLAQMIDQVSESPSRADQLPKLPGHEQDELGHWVSAANHLLRSVKENERARRDVEQQLRIVSERDKLTGLPDRRAFFERVLASCEAAAASDKRVCVLYVDVREFHHINDTYGIHVGDRLLQEVSRRFSAVAGNMRMVARLGGDRFGIVVPDVGELGAVRQLCDSLIKSMRAPFHVDDQHIRINIAIGVAVFPDDSMDTERLGQDAEKALAMAKRDGRSRYQFYYSELGDVMRNHRRMMRDLENALQRDELTLHYQPQYELTTGKLVGAETLIRWNHPILGNVSPAVFIPVAEQSALMDDICDWVMGRACHEAACWSGRDAPSVAVNVSATQLSGENLRERVRRSLVSSGLPAQRLELEITETAVMDDVDLARNVLEEMNELGIRISMDDFGTRFASLNYVLRLPLSKLKIDQSFVQEIGLSVEADAIVRTVINLGHSLGLTVIAEGVETLEQLEFLSEARCNMVQGYLLARPLTSQDFASLLARPQQLPDQVLDQLRAAPADRRQPRLIRA